MTPEELFLENLKSIERIAAFVARRNHLNADEAEEFVQEVQFRLVDNDYAIIRKYEGRSRFTTYLTTVIDRLHHQYRIEQWGKWRPSAEAKRQGSKAITLERLLTRDGFTFDEAVKVLTTPAGSPYTVAELEAIYLRLPPRMPRPVVVAEESAPDAVAVEAEADDRVELRDRERAARDAESAIDRHIGSLDPEDQLILQLRFWQGLKIPDIARRLHMDQKKIYKRLERLLHHMRRKLEEVGLRKSDIDRLLCRGDQELRFDFPVGLAEMHGFGPSHDSGGEGARGGEGGMR